MPGLEQLGWLGRVQPAAGVITGAAFAVGERRLLTCAHVALDAGADGPGGQVWVAFPTLDGERYAAQVMAEGWRDPQDSVGDIALLEFVCAAPAGLQAAPERALPSLDGLAFTVYGFPAGYDDGVPTEGAIGKRAGVDWVKLEVTSAFAVERGFSGGAVWSDEHRRVVALMTTRDKKTEGRVEFAIPVGVVAAASAVVADALPTPLDLDPKTSTHWGPRARGVNSDADEAAWMFTGRQYALGQLVAWLEEADAPQRMRVVTGVPVGEVGDACALGDHG